MFYEALWRSSLGKRAAEKLVRGHMERAGIELNGSRPHDVQIHDDRAFGRFITDGLLGYGEAYMDGWWDCEALDVAGTKMLLSAEGALTSTVKRRASQWSARLINMQSSRRAFAVGEQHYDIGNALYRAMLDKHLSYTCAYWTDAETLDEAQEAKLDLVCRKLRLKPGMRVLELGCGWASFAAFAAQRYGVEVTGYTVSKEQVALGRERCKGLPVDLHLADYRKAEGAFDAVLSIGLLEHIGHRNYRTYFEVVDRCLKPDGVAFVHTIASHTTNHLIDPWFHKYIFPNAQLPSLQQIGTATEGLFTLEDLHNIGPDYDRTLMAWWDNFEAAWPELRKEGRYDERFFRMWRFYLLSSASAFRARRNHLYQMVLTRLGTRQPECRVT